MYIMFYSTSDVFRAEDKLKKENISIEVVPTPATDRAYCGVCLKVKSGVSLESISNIEFSTMEVEDV